MLTAKGLEVLLLGKEVTMPDGTSLGVATAIRKEFSQDKLWMVVDNQGQESILPIEYIASVTDKVILLNDLLSVA
jgi:hypothetical protein